MFQLQTIVELARASDAKPAFWYQQEKIEEEIDSLRSLVEDTTTTSRGDYTAIPSECVQTAEGGALI